VVGTCYQKILYTNNTMLINTCILNNPNHIFTPNWIVILEINSVTKREEGMINNNEEGQGNLKTKKKVKWG